MVIVHIQGVIGLNVVEKEKCRKTSHMHIAVFIRRNETAELVFVHESNNKIKCLTQLNNNKDQIVHTAK